MKRITKLMLALALCVLGVGNSKVYAGLVPGNEFTSVADLNGKVFAIVNKADGKAICNQNAGENDYDLSYLPYADAFSAASLGYLFKIEEAHGEGYLLHCLNAQGESYNLFGWWPAYFQSHKAGTDKCYFLFNDINSETDKDKGGDGDGYTVWDIQYVDGKGFTLQNIGTSAEDPAADRYLNDPTKRADNVTPGYFQFCELVNANPTISIENPANLVEIPQEQNQVEEGVFHKASVSGPTDGVTTYTTTGDVCIIVKTLDVNVADCDFISYKFAEPIPAGIQYAVWSKEGNKCVMLETGITEFKYVFSDDKECAVSEDIIPQVSLVTVFASGGKVVKVKGIYKHNITETTYNRTYSFNQALDFTGIEGLKAYVISAYDNSTATLTLAKVTKVPANTGLFLVGKDGDYEIPIIDSADPIAANLLHTSSGTDALEPTEGTNTNLIFGGTGADRGFHPLSSAGIIGGNKAYLQLPTADLPAAGSRLNLVFEDETSAINTVNKAKVVDDTWYTVNGVKFNAKPTRKGIYLNNGKKFAVR